MTAIAMASRDRLPLLPLCAGVAALLGLAPAPAVAATTRPVISCEDSGPGSLRAVVAASASGDTVDYSQLQCQQSVISLQSGIVVAQNDLRIVGNRDTILFDKYDRIFTHTGSGALTVTDIGVGGGSVVGTDVRGGCIASAGKVVVYDSLISNCYAHATSGFVYGGAVYGRDGVVVKYSEISDSTAKSESSYASGGGIGAAGSLLVRYSTIARNHANGTPGHGGGALTIGSSSIDHSTFVANSASTSGGGFFQRGVGNVSLRSSTISGNHAPWTGGTVMQNSPYVTIANSTIAFNTANYASDAVGLAITSSPTSTVVRLQSTLVSNNASPFGDFDLGQTTGSGATITFDPSSSANLVRVPGPGTLPAGTLTLSCPLLGPLRDNGGWTQTHALASRSIAIDHGDNPLADAQDQRGKAGNGALFPRVSNGKADIGAFEVNQADAIFAAGNEGCAPID
jgi:hypothetical protein